nr:MAG TPA: hypothetical protein [Caudoviricetes sp.]
MRRLKPSGFVFQRAYFAFMELNLHHSQIPLPICYAVYILQ